MQIEGNQLDVSTEATYEAIEFSLGDSIWIFLFNVFCGLFYEQSWFKKSCCISKRSKMLLKVFDEGTERVEEELSMEKLLKSTRNLVTLLKNKGLMKEQDEVELIF